MGAQAGLRPGGLQVRRHSKETPEEGRGCGVWGTTRVQAQEGGLCGSVSFNSQLTVASKKREVIS